LQSSTSASTAKTGVVMEIRFALRGTLLLLLAPCCAGQEITATILGTVTDKYRGAIFGATITVTNTDQGLLVRRLTTSRSGEYVVPLLPTAHYEVGAEAPGFQTSVETGIELNVNDQRAVNFVLQVRGVKDVVKVEADPFQVN